MPYRHSPSARTPPCTITRADTRRVHWRRKGKSYLRRKINTTAHDHEVDQVGGTQDGRPRDGVWEDGRLAHEQLLDGGETVESEPQRFTKVSLRGSTVAMNVANEKKAGDLRPSLLPYTRPSRLTNH